MTVRVANDFKTEAQHELEKLVLENKTLRDKVRSLESQLEKLKGMFLVLYLVYAVHLLSRKCRVLILHRPYFVPIFLLLLVGA